MSPGSNCDAAPRRPAVLEGELAAVGERMELALDLALELRSALPAAKERLRGLEAECERLVVGALRVASP